jgi:hypothetical protein
MQSASLPLLTRLLGAAAQAVQIKGLELQLSASLGVTLFPQSEDVKADQLLRQACVFQRSWTPVSG